MEGALKEARDCAHHSEQSSVRYGVMDGRVSDERKVGGSWL